MVENSEADGNGLTDGISLSFL